MLAGSSPATVPSARRDPVRCAKRAAGDQDKHLRRTGLDGIPAADQHPTNALGNVTSPTVRVVANGISR